MWLRDLIASWFSEDSAGPLDSDLDDHQSDSADLRSSSDLRSAPAVADLPVE